MGASPTPAGAAALLLPSPATPKKYLQIADGRDKALKIVQYLFKVLLWAELITKKSHPVLHPRVAATVAQFSLTRRVLRLLHAIEPYAELRDLVVHEGGLAGTVGKPGLTLGQRAVQLLGWINPAASLVNDIVDDIICLAKIGAVDKTWSKRLDMTSTRLWFLTILIDVFDNYRGQVKLVADLARKRNESAQLHATAAAFPSPVSQASSPTLAPNATAPPAITTSATSAVAQSQAATLAAARAAVAAAEHKLWMQRVSFVKLMADFAFCWVDLRQLEGRAPEGVQAIVGLLAALLGTYKIWVKCK